MMQFLIRFKKDIFIKCLFIFYIAVTLFLVASCNSNFTAKPKGYFSIDFPKHEYQQFDQPGYPYTFEYPVYAKILKDSTFFDKKPENPWWINIDFPQFAGRIYVSYKEIGIGKYNFDTLNKQTYMLTGKHSSKAYSIDDSLINTPNEVHGVFFSVGGEVATSNQFYLTDSTKHFLRGALYFDATPNADSLGIVNQFLLQDMKHLINTFKWRK
jgi:gliding motility-associated lipoprotein GldD